MKTVVALSATLLVILMCSACSNSYNNSPTAPTDPTTPPPAGATQIGIVGDRGNQSFNPNPAAVTQGQTMTWKNNDGITHRIVADDGSFDTGNVGGGQFSAAVTLKTNGASYHCSIHPDMVGTISATSAAN
jgi:plastocyanin